MKNIPKRTDPIDLRDEMVRQLLGGFIAREIAELARDRTMTAQELSEHVRDTVLPRFLRAMDVGLLTLAARLMVDAGHA